MVHTQRMLCRVMRLVKFPTIIHRLSNNSVCGNQKRFALCQEKTVPLMDEHFIKRTHRLDSILVFKLNQIQVHEKCLVILCASFVKMDVQNFGPSLWQWGTSVRICKSTLNFLDLDQTNELYSTHFKRFILNKKTYNWHTLNHCYILSQEPK